MPINLLKLPRLVGVLVVSELLDYQEIFLLSICSRRTKCLVEKARIRVPKLSFRFGECNGYNEFKIGFEIDPRVFKYGLFKPIWLPVTSFLHVHNLDLKKVSTVKLGIAYEAAINVHLLFDEDGRFLHRIECANDPMEIQKALQDHIKAIFHYSETSQLFLSMKCEGSLPNITNVAHIEIEDGTVDPQFLANVSTTYSDHRSLLIESSIVGELPKDSSFFQVQNVVVRSQCESNYFRNFGGRNMRLLCVTLTDQDLIQFLHEWISNKAYHNLETLSIVPEPTYRINEDLIRQSIEFEEYDPNEPERRPDHFDYDIPVLRYLSRKYELRHWRVLEIKRITDGKRAFLRLHYRLFQLFVLPN